MRSLAPDKLPPFRGHPFRIRDDAMNCFCGREAAFFSFYRIPKLLIAGIRFAEIKCEAKLLYRITLDRVELSTKNMEGTSLSRRLIDGIACQTSRRCGYLKPGNW